jgi:hypothetical protein
MVFENRLNQHRMNTELEPQSFSFAEAAGQYHQFLASLVLAGAKNPIVDRQNLTP